MYSIIQQSTIAKIDHQVEFSVRKGTFSEFIILFLQTPKVCTHMTFLLNLAIGIVIFCTIDFVAFYTGQLLYHRTFVVKIFE